MNINFNSMTNAVKNQKNSELSELFNYKLTENGDITHRSTGNHLIDLIFQAEYYQKHLNEVKIGNSDLEKLFSMFMRDPRHGMKYRNLGRVLMRKSGVSPQAVAFAGRFDDLWENPIGNDFNENWISYLFEQCRAGNELAKKWMPHYVATKENGKVAKSTLMASRFRNLLGMNKQQYNKFVKCPTVESKLSQHMNDMIEFDKIPSLALLKYWARFAGTSKKHPKTDMAERFNAYLESVKKGDKKMNFSTATVYDIYRNANTIDTDLAFSQIEKISGNWIPIVDTSASMFTDDAMGKALAIGHYLGKCSTYCPNQVITFSSRPQLIELGVTKPYAGHIYYRNNIPLNNGKNYNKEILSMYTGDCSNTNFAAVMSLLSGLKTEFPEYLIVLSDMEFDEGGYQETNMRTMKRWRDQGIKTKLVWWNLNTRNRTSPQSVKTDADGNIFISGYDPTMLKFLSCEFDAEKFISKLLTEYAKTIPNDMVL